MARHTYPLRRTDDLAYPIRVKVIVPGSGFGGLLDQMNEWRQQHAPDSAHHPGQSNAASHSSAIYFRRIEEAEAFLAAFPILKLADGVGAMEVRGPTAPHGEGYGRGDN